MYANVRHYTMGAGSHDALMHRVDEEFAPAISQEPGFVGYFMLDTSPEPGFRSFALDPGDSNGGGSQHLPRQGIRGAVQRACC